MVWRNPIWLLVWLLFPAPLQGGQELSAHAHVPSSVAADPPSSESDLFGARHSAGQSGGHVASPVPTPDRGNLLEESSREFQPTDLPGSGHPSSPAKPRRISPPIIPEMLSGVSDFHSGHLVHSGAISSFSTGLPPPFIA